MLTINKVKVACAIATAEACVAMLDELRRRIEEAEQALAGEFSFGLDGTTAEGKELESYFRLVHDTREGLDVVLAKAPDSRAALSALLTYAARHDSRPLPNSSGEAAVERAHRLVHGLPRLRLA